MNYPIAIVCGMMLLCFAAHLTGGVIQSLSIKPSKVAKSHFAGVRVHSCHHQYKNLSNGSYEDNPAVPGNDNRVVPSSDSVG